MYEVNRSVLVLVPQAPFWNWLSHLPDIDLDGLELEDLQADSNAYLIDPVDEEEEAWEMISAKVDTIFSAELADWCEDSSLWPDLHADIFFEWFDVCLSGILTDWCHADLRREAFEPIDLNDPE